MTTWISESNSASETLANRVFALGNANSHWGEELATDNWSTRTYRYRHPNVVTVIIVTDKSLSGDAALTYRQMQIPRESYSMAAPERLGAPERQARTEALAKLFAWVAAQPPVPHVPLEALDRDEMY